MSKKGIKTEWGYSVMFMQNAFMALSCGMNHQQNQKLELISAVLFLAIVLSFYRLKIDLNTFFPLLPPGWLLALDASNKTIIPDGHLCIYLLLFFFSLIGQRVFEWRSQSDKEKETTVDLLQCLWWELVAVGSGALWRPLVRSLMLHFTAESWESPQHSSPSQVLSGGVGFEPKPQQ